MGCVCGPSAGQRHGSPCDKRQMGRPPALDSGRAKLSLAYGAWRRYSALWLAAALLELPLEASEEQAVLDYSSATWPGDWAVPLGKQAAFWAGALPTSHLPR